MGCYRDITQIFKTLAGGCDILLTKGCSMHVHVAPNMEGQWTPTTLPGPVKGIAVFDDAITKIMPADRKVNPWCRSNFHDIPGSTRPEDKATPKLKLHSDAKGRSRCLMSSTRESRSTGRRRSPSWAKTAQSR